MDESLYENFICNLCLEPYTEPKSLPCLHCFCLECLLQYLQSRQPTTASPSSVLYYDNFPCPVCKYKVRLEWQQRLSFANLRSVVDSFPDNFHMVNLMQQLDIRPVTKFCGICMGDDIQSKSVSWCQDCYQSLCESCTNSHRTLQLTSDHTLIEDCSVKGFLFANNAYPCPKHDTESLRSFCNKCKVCICYKCHLTDHKNCEKIILLEEAVADYSTTADLIIDSLKKHMEEMVLLRDKITKQRNTALDRRTSIVSDIQDTTSRLIDSLKMNETNLIEELEKFYKEEDAKREILENDINDTLSNLSETYKIFENCYRGKNEPQFLNLVNTIDKKIPDNAKKVKKLLERIDKEKRHFRFDMNTKIQECLRKLEGLPLGTVTITSETPTEEVGNDAIVRYNLPKIDSSTSMNFIETTEVATETALVEVSNEKSRQVKPRGLLSWLCRRGPPKVPHITRSISQSKTSLLADGVIFLSAE
ncbi:tripartite motif-containing protein 45 [Octopus sinensis]|uniref:Tripartite motif-containing protein 45 n=1 Tax=Octopus sinensis TaxID=2607531 RepID=A0A6P7T9H4_9MOLL|nr:tripartite motif-containing protein 45 [Octopus sinensis]